jgi:prevent-host-death family protein
VKKKTTAVSYEIGEEITRPMVLNEVAALPGYGESISVRAAKAHLSGLLDLVATARKEIVITSDGKPKARVVPVETRPKRKVFSGAGAHLRTMPKQSEGPFAEELIRADRDGRGW